MSQVHAAEDGSPLLSCDLAAASPRYPSLDALRGLAAFVVVLSHLYPALLGTPIYAAFAPLLDTLPLHVLVNGEAAVILFFVLSGFVLSLTATIDSPIDYGAYAIRRIARIWLPYVVALLFFIAASQALLDRFSPPYTSLDKAWHTAVTPRLLLMHLSLIGPLDQRQYLGVSWSLVHEMRISLLFPFLLLATRRLPDTALLVLCAVLLYGGRTLALSQGVLQFSTGWLNTIYYAGMFIPGVLLARRRAVLARWCVRRTGMGVAVAAALLLICGDLIWPRIGLDPAVPLPEILGCTLLIAIGVALGARRNPLTSALPIWLGRCSFSLYLWHPVALMVVFRLGHAVFGPAALGLIVLASSLALAALAYRLVDTPAIELGRILSRRLRDQQRRTRPDVPREDLVPEGPAPLTPVIAPSDQYRL